jgi:hypothetical protein
MKEKNKPEINIYIQKTKISCTYQPKQKIYQTNKAEIKHKKTYILLSTGTKANKE